MYCPKCGAKNNDDAGFCGSCGAPLKRDASVSQRGVANAAGAAAATAKSKSWLKIVIPVVAVIAIIALVFFVLNSCGGSGVTPKPSVNDYTWEELSKISAEIGKKGNEDAAVNVAKKYNLVSSDGKLDGTQTKTIQLTDGTTVTVQIAGFSHDEKTGGGKAGITFIFKDIIAEHAMNSTNTSSGGWEKSAMRSWLSSSGLSMLPPDLTNRIVAVDKKTNNTGETANVSSVTTTSDKIWLFADIELYGEQQVRFDSLTGKVDTQAAKTYNEIRDAEGHQYKLFKDCNVNRSGVNNILSKSYKSSTHSWLERSPNPSFPDTFWEVSHQGRDIGGPPFNSSSSNGVVPGFCL